MPASAELPKTYDPSQVESAIYALWEEQGAFAARPDDRPPDRRFVIMIPLPNVTGALHLGHAINNTLQDVQIRYHRMLGDNTLWQPGTDHAGIATQAVVERRIFEDEGKSRHELGREELVRRIWAWKDQYEARILGQLKQMGCSCDWSRTRFTLDEVCAKAVRHAFFKLFADGLIYRGKRLVNWDTQLQTAVADDEVYHETVKGHFWHFRYPVIDPQPGEPEHVIIATTRPETMLGDTAVAVNPDPEVEFDRREQKLRAELAGASGKERAEIEARLTRIAERRQTHLGLLVTLRNMARDGRKVLLPLVDRPIPLVCDEHADPELGSGCVKITPAHDPNDYEVGQRAGLPMVNVLTADGKVAEIIEPDGARNPNSDRYAGLAFATEGRRRVVADLEALGLLGEVEDRQIEIGHSDRSKTPIEPYLSDQWFVRMGDLNEPRTSVRADSDQPRAAEPAGEPRTSVRADSDQPRAPESAGEPRTSVRAAVPGDAPPVRRPTPDLSAGAILLTWTMYGTWLPGDERGFVSRVPLANGGHTVHNLPGEPYDAEEPQVRDQAREDMEGEPVHLSPDQARVLLGSIAASAERHAVELLAVAIMASHVHVLCQAGRPGEELLKLFKGAAARLLNQQFTLSDSPRWFTRRGSARFIKAGADLTAAIEYVQHQQRPHLVWSFDAEEGEAAGIVQAARTSEGGPAGQTEVRRAWHSARTEVRGSSGVVLADGSVSPGLAQAAMDAVTGGRVRIFPERYTKTYLDWLTEKRDWCISRQLWWGHRIPVWSKVYPAETGEADSLKDLPESGDTVMLGEGRWLHECDGEPHFVRQVRRAGQEVTSYICPAERHTESLAALLEQGGYEQDEAVLDTWFSSQLWPFSTLGWPDKGTQTDRDVDFYFPGSVLITSRDIISLWVARMVISGLYLVGDVPFRHVYIHTKILDGRGDTMSKSKGNGVDPVDIIRLYGADALRYTIADMATETQDVRMPVEYLCPHCGHLTPQTSVVPHNKRPSDVTKAKCQGCGQPFATQWADAALKEELGVALDTSDKFELGRNFANKLWNAARFGFLNLEGTPYEPIAVADLPPEDRWILARLSNTVRRANEQLRTYQFAQCIKDLREFFWDALCDWYVELTKARLTGAQNEPRASARAASNQPVTPGKPTTEEPRASAGADSNQAATPDRPDHPDAQPPTGGAARSGEELSGARRGEDPREVNFAARGVTRQILAFVYDQTLRLLHPFMPFITERLWRQLNEIAPRRGLPGVAEPPGNDLLITAAFPPAEGWSALDDEGILEIFEELQAATRGVRDLRSRCNVPPRQPVDVTLNAPAGHVEALRGDAHVLQRLANVGTLTVTSGATRPKNAGTLVVGHVQIFVHDISDDTAEAQRLRKEIAATDKQIAASRARLGNEKFVANARPEVVQDARDRLADLEAKAAGLRANLELLG